MFREIKIIQLGSTMNPSFIVELMGFPSAIVQPKKSSLGLTLKPTTTLSLFARCLKLTVCGEVERPSEDGSAVVSLIDRVNRADRVQRRAWFN